MRVFLMTSLSTSKIIVENMQTKHFSQLMVEDTRSDLQLTKGVSLGGHTASASGQLFW